MAGVICQLVERTTKGAGDGGKLNWRRNMEYAPVPNHWTSLLPAEQTSKGCHKHIPFPAHITRTLCCSRRLKSTECKVHLHFRERMHNKHTDVISLLYLTRALHQRADARLLWPAIAVAIKEGAGAQRLGHEKQIARLEVCLTCLCWCWQIGCDCIHHACWMSMCFQTNAVNVFISTSSK